MISLWLAGVCVCMRASTCVCVCVCVYVRPALAGVELEEDAEAVAQPGVVLRDRVVPQQHQAGEHLGAGDAAGVHELGQALRRLDAQVRHLENIARGRSSKAVFADITSRATRRILLLIESIFHLAVQELRQHHEDTLRRVLGRVSFLLGRWSVLLLSF